MKILSIVGARPQFIKVKPFDEGLKKRKIPHVLVHTGQHYDFVMSRLFFKELRISRPHYNLNVGPTGPNQQISMMLKGLDRILTKEKPGLVMVYGDTTSTLAGCLAAVNLQIPVAHVEAGLRSYRRDMPEETNRILTDHMAALRFCPTRAAVTTLAREGLRQGTVFVGDIMYDLFKANRRQFSTAILGKLNLRPRQYYLLTIHRQYNVDNIHRLKVLLGILGELKTQIVFPVHPRTKKMLKKIKGRKLWKNFLFLDPVSYLNMLSLEQHALKILTDSGGVQKEAYFMKVPCITLREETEWPETLVGRWNTLTGVIPRRISRALQEPPPRSRPQPYFGRGDAAGQIIKTILRWNKQ